MEKNKCILCKKRYKGYGNNAQPLAEGQCCDACNKDVIVKRLDNMMSKRMIGVIMMGFKEERYNVAQQIANDLFDKTYGKDQKGNLWVCHRLKDGEDPPHSTSRKGRCEHCGHSICWDPEVAKRMSKKAIKICRVCVVNVKKFNKDMTKEQKDLLGVIYGKDDK